MTDPRISEDSLAIVLLTAVLDKRGRGSQPGGASSVAPLTPSEYASLADALHRAGHSPGTLLGITAAVDIEALVAPTPFDAQRISELLDRRAAIGMLLDRVHTAGMWVLTRSDRAYPRRLKRLLGPAAPPMFYGVGPAELLEFDACIGVVGSRSIDETGAAFARHVGGTCARDRGVLVSGGAQGADEVAMRVAIDSGGRAVGFLGKDLARELTRPTWRSAIAAERCTLVSSVSPWAGFRPGNMMARNKCIYAMCRAVFVASSDTKGGTWTGALENERRSWSQLFVRAGVDAPAGNADLIAAHGGSPIEASAITDGFLRAIIDAPDAATSARPEPTTEQLALG